MDKLVRIFLNLTPIKPLIEKMENYLFIIRHHLEALSVLLNVDIDNYDLYISFQMMSTYSVTIGRSWMCLCLQLYSISSPCWPPQPSPPSQPAAQTEPISLSQPLNIFFWFSQVNWWHQSFLSYELGLAQFDWPGQGQLSCWELKVWKSKSKQKNETFWNFKRSRFYETKVKTVKFNEMEDFD